MPDGANRQERPNRFPVGGSPRPVAERLDKRGDHQFGDPRLAQGLPVRFDPAAGEPASRLPGILQVSEPAPDSAGADPEQPAGGRVNLDWPRRQQLDLASPATVGRCGGALHALSVTALEQVLGSCLEALGAEHLEAESVGEPVGRVERGADRQRVLDLLG
jgi:hypothetical protein